MKLVTPRIVHGFNSSTSLVRFIVLLLVYIHTPCLYFRNRRGQFEIERSHEIYHWVIPATATWSSRANRGEVHSWLCR